MHDLQAYRVDNGNPERLKPPAIPLRDVTPTCTKLHPLLVEPLALVHVDNHGPQGRGGGDDRKGAANPNTQGSGFRHTAAVPDQLELGPPRTLEVVGGTSSHDWSKSCRRRFEEFDRFAVKAGASR